MKKYFYIAKSTVEPSIYKIGITNDFESRMRQIKNYKKELFGKSLNFEPIYAVRTNNSDLIESLYLETLKNRIPDTECFKGEPVLLMEKLKQLECYPIYPIGQANEISDNISLKEYYRMRTQNINLQREYNICLKKCNHLLKYVCEKFRLETEKEKLEARLLKFLIEKVLPDEELFKILCETQEVEHKISDIDNNLFDNSIL